MLLAIVLMALISIHGCGLDDPADADLLLEEQMIKNGTHPIHGSWAIYALVDANGKETIVDWPNARTAVFSQDKRFEGNGCNYIYSDYKLLNGNKIKLNNIITTEMACIDTLRKSLDEAISTIISYKIINGQLLLFYDGGKHMLLKRTIEE